MADGEAAAESPNGEIAVEPTEAAVVVVLRGEHDLTTAQQIRVALDEAIAVGRPVVLDVSETSFADTSVLHAIFVAAGRLKDEGRRFVVQCPRELPVYRVFEVSGLASGVPFCDTRDLALAEAAS
jgi:anti-sigma B factor antagonist